MMTRYIDAEELVEYCKHQQSDERNKRAAPNRWSDAFGEFIDIIRETPAEDVEPIKHGKWIKNEDRTGWHCSCCGVDNYYAYSWNSESGKNDFQDKYCPNCGARMEDEK